MRLHSSLLSCVIAGTLSPAGALPGCSAPATATTQTERELPDDLPDGMVRVPEASCQCVVVEAAGPVTEDGALRVPARVEFKDGAVSQVGAPLDGRVVHVHVSTGDTVRAGSPLVTLDCPEAASVRAAVDTANPSLLEARASLDRERRMLEEGIGIEREKLAAETKVTELEAELARAQARTSLVGPGAGPAGPARPGGHGAAGGNRRSLRVVGRCRRVRTRSPTGATGCDGPRRVALPSTAAPRRWCGG